MNQLKKIVLCIIALINRYPWAIALFGFVSGVASFLLIERNQQFAQIIAIFMLVSWVWLMLENLLTRGVAHWFGLTLPPPLLNFATQLVHQESLFFVIPFFVVTTAWNSGQAVFTSLLIVASFISIVDPIYYRWLAPRRWLYFIFHGVTLFAVLLTALPILFHLSTAKSYQWALIIAVILSFPSAARSLPLSGWRRILTVLALALITSSLGLWARTWVPPASLWLTEVAITNHIDDINRSPQNSLTMITADQARAGLYAYTAIHAPRGLNERIYHVWQRNGREVDRIALDIRGGREAGYRAWSHKVNFPPYPSGIWKIHVVTEGDRLIGVLRFQIVDATEAATIESETAVSQPSPNENTLLEIINDQVSSSAENATVPSQLHSNNEVHSSDRPKNHSPSHTNEID